MEVIVSRNTGVLAFLKVGTLILVDTGRVCIIAFSTVLVIIGVTVGDIFVAVTTYQ